ncbi:MAG: hypothetical protein Q9160_008316 [Pyrenula sp. 1 TL-2023]
MSASHDSAFIGQRLILTKSFLNANPSKPIHQSQQLHKLYHPSHPNIKPSHTLPINPSTHHDPSPPSTSSSSPPPSRPLKSTPSSPTPPPPPIAATYSPSPSPPFLSSPLSSPLSHLGTFPPSPSPAPLISTTSSVVLDSRSLRNETVLCVKWDKWTERIDPHDPSDRDEAFRQRERWHAIRVRGEDAAERMNGVMFLDFYQAEVGLREEDGGIARFGEAKGGEGKWWDGVLGGGALRDGLRGWRREARLRLLSTDSAVLNVATRAKPSEHAPTEPIQRLSAPPSQHQNDHDRVEINSQI